MSLSCHPGLPVDGALAGMTILFIYYSVILSLIKYHCNPPLWITKNQAQKQPDFI